MFHVGVAVQSRPEHLSSDTKHTPVTIAISLVIALAPILALALIIALALAIFLVLAVSLALALALDLALTWPWARALIRMGHGLHDIYPPYISCFLALTWPWARARIRMPLLTVMADPTLPPRTPWRLRIALLHI